MCGIVGKINLDGASVAVREIEAMRRMLVHRGPDDAGRTLFSLRSGKCVTPRHGDAEGPVEGFEGALGFNRLSIIDLSINGHQPMHSLDGRAIIVFNGEIYNADEYRSELERRGCRFRGTSDTEILLNLYTSFGIDEALRRLNGMFAFCIVDLLAREVHLARDRMGIKPLYIHHTPRVFMFASEVKAFLPSTDFVPALNPEVVDEFAKFGCVAGAETLFRGVTNVEPGERITLKRGELKRQPYWTIPPAQAQASMTADEAEDLVEDMLARSVRYRLKSDVPVGCQLSGGIDSSLITLLATRQMTGKPPTSVSVVHENRKFSEEPWIDQVSAKLGIQAQKYQLTDLDFLGNLAKATWHRDLPMNSASGIPIMLMSGLAKQHFTVFLSGEGADELFGGYERFFGGHFLGNRVNYNLLRFSPFANHLLKSRYLSADGGGFDRRDWFITRSSFFGEECLRRLRPGFDGRRFMRKRRELFDSSEGDFISRAQHYELRTWLVDLLLRQDTMTMANSVENRVPFLDHNMVALARRIPTSNLVGRDPRFTRSTKIVLKRLAVRHFGKRFAYRRKIGFELPLADYFSTPRFDSWLRDEIIPGIAARGVFDPAAVMRYRNAGKKRATYENVYSVWRMVAFEVWAQQMLDRKAQAVG